jgi:hypothetical protein
MYLIDANVLIDAKNRYYAFDIVPAFWDWLIRAHHAGKVFTVQKVHDEVVAGGDDLATWIQTLPASFRLMPAQNDQASLRVVSQWVTSCGKYDPAALSTFLATADYYLVSQAHSLGYTVVTHEVASSGSKRVKIPDACNGVQVACMTPFKMLRIERACFRL